MCDKIPSPLCNCKDYLLPKDVYCHPIMCHHGSICRLRKLLDEPLSADCYEQQIFYLFDYIKFCKNGFYLVDLDHLSRVLELIAEKIDKVEIYRPYCKKLLDIAALPPLKHNYGEEISEIGRFSEYMSVLGFLGIWLHDTKLRHRAYHAIYHLLTVKESALNISKLSFRLQCVEKSHLPEIIVQLLDLAPNDEYYEILNISLILTEISAAVCKKMVLVNAIDYLLLRLLPDPDNVDPEIMQNIKHTENYLEIVNITCQVLINLVANIKHLDQAILKKIIPSLNSMWAIRYVFRGLLYGKYSQLSRNNLMAFIMLCLDTFPYIEITECHLLDGDINCSNTITVILILKYVDLALLSVATEVSNNAWIKDIHFTNSEHDVFFKKMLVLTLSYAWKYPNFHLIFDLRNVVPGLIKILATEYITDWHCEEHETLIEYTLISLYYIAPQLINSFMENEGIQSLLIIIETYYLLSNDCHRTKLLLTLRLFAKIVELENVEVVDVIRAHYGICVLNLQCDAILQKDILRASDRELLSYCFHILSYLYIKPIVNDPSLNFLIRYFQRIIKPSFSDSVPNPRSVICAINLLWEITCDNSKKLREFINEEGVYMLLDIIDTNSFPVKIVGLGCLTDICDDPFCVPFLLTWRGGDDKKTIFSSLLAKVFREECKKIGTRLNKNDIILDINYPLLGKTQYQEVMSPNKDCHTFAAIIDMIGSSRPKIYALLQLLNTRYEETVELINEYYKIAFTPIPRNDKVILHLAHNFFALKLSEAWHELAHDLEISNIEPVDIDAQLITILTEQMQKWNESIKSGQEAILQSEIHNEESKEMELYDTLRKCRLQEAIEALKQMKFIARTTDRMFRMAHKETQRKDIKDALTDVLQIDEIKRTYKEKLDVTVVVPQKYYMEYNTNESNIIFHEDQVSRFSIITEKYSCT